MVTIKRIGLGAIFLFLLFAAEESYGSTLKEIFESAQKNDPQLSSAQYLVYAAKGNQYAECGKLFPQAAAYGGYLSYEQDKAGTILGDTIADTNAALDGTQSNYGMLVTQTLFDAEKFNACRTSRIQRKVEGASYELALEDLISRVIHAYMDVLSARSKVHAKSGAVDLYAALLRESKQGYNAHTVALKDLESARAKLARAKAEHSIAQKEVTVAELKLTSLSNGLSIDDIAPTLSNEITQSAPSPLEPKHWADVAAEYNLKIIANELATKTQHSRMNEAKSLYLPTADAYARYNNYDSDIDYSSTSTSSDFDTKTYGVRANWKFFAGGSNYGRSMAEKNRYLSALEVQNGLERQVRLDAQTAVLNITTALASIDAAHSSMTAAETNLSAEISARSARTATQADVLDAKHALLDARYEYDHAYYQYMLALADFWQATGSLSVSSIDHVNQWLKK